jgi:hypothetical protein
LKLYVCKRGPLRSILAGGLERGWLKITKSLLREQFWFPGIDRLGENEIQNCIACQDTVECKNTEPLKMTKLPEGRWREL